MSNIFVSLLCSEIFFFLCFKNDFYLCHFYVYSNNVEICSLIFLTEFSLWNFNCHFTCNSYFYSSLFFSSDSDSFIYVFHWNFLNFLSVFWAICIKFLTNYFCQSRKDNFIWIWDCHINYNYAFNDHNTEVIYLTPYFCRVICNFDFHEFYTIYIIIVTNDFLSLIYSDTITAVYVRYNYVCIVDINLSTFLKFYGYCLNFLTYGILDDHSYIYEVVESFLNYLNEDFNRQNYHLFVFKTVVTYNWVEDNSHILVVIVRNLVRWIVYIHIGNSDSVFHFVYISEIDHGIFFKFHFVIHKVEGIHRVRDKL